MHPDDDRGGGEGRAGRPVEGAHDEVAGGVNLVAGPSEAEVAGARERVVPEQQRGVSHLP